MSDPSSIYRSAWRCDPGLLRRLTHGHPHSLLLVANSLLAGVTLQVIAHTFSYKLTTLIKPISRRDRYPMQPAVRGLDVSSVVVPHWFIPIFTDADGVASDHDLPIAIPSPSTWSLSGAKRALDFCTALLALAMLAVPMMVIAICVRLSSRGAALFVQKRVGRDGRLFEIYKFRSMAQGASSGPGLTSSGDRRVTSFGRVIRKFKLDELPQFYNILRGDMSLVGPRPKLPIYEPIANMPYRPGITGAATLAFRHEEDILGGVHFSQMEYFYTNQIKPLKAQIDLQYMSNATLWSDMCMIASTLLACFAPREIQAAPPVEEIRRKSDSMIA